MGKKLLLLLSMMTLVLAFQNCGKTLMQQPFKVLESKGNGEGYDGKPEHKYIHYDTQGICTGHTLTYISAIEQFLNGFYLVADNCEPIAPRLLSDAEVSALPHNSDYALFQDQVYQIEQPGSGNGSGNAAEPGVTHQLLCRGEENLGSLTAVSDVLVSQVGSTYRLQVTRGEYSPDGNLSGEAKEQVDAQKNGTGYTGDLVSPESLSLQMDAQDQGTLQYQLKFGASNTTATNANVVCYRF